MLNLFQSYKEQYRLNLKLALPVILTQLGQIFTQFVDNVMVGQYGGDNPTPLAAASFGGVVFFILFIASIGVALGMTPLIGELFTQKRHRESAQLLQNGILFYTLLGILVAGVQYLIIPLMYRMGQPVEVVDAAIPYYKMLIYSLPFIMLFFSFKQFLEGVGNTKAETVVTILSNISNCLFNWLFIYGNLGCPEMGVEGAGFGTLLARVVSPVLVISYFLWNKTFRSYLNEFTWSDFSLSTIGRLLRMGIPISFQMFLEASAFVGTSIMMGWLGTQAISANQIAGTLGNCSFMIILSLGAATTIRISHAYGRRDVDEVALAGKASYHLVLMWCALCAVLYISLRHIIPLLFTSNAEVIAIASDLMFFIAMYQLSDGLQNASVSILRGLQDVKIIIPIAFLSYWVLNLPVGYFFGFVLGMGPSGLFLGFTFGLSSAAVLMILRIRRRMRKLRILQASGEFLSEYSREGL